MTTAPYMKRDYLFRFQKVKFSPGIWKPEFQIKKYIRTAYLVTTIGYGLMVIWNGIVDLKISRLYNTCLKGPSEDLTSNNPLTIVFVLPMILAILGSIILDLHVFLKLKNMMNLSTMNEAEIANHQNNVKKVVTDMPIKTSLINTLFLVPYLGIIYYSTTTDPTDENIELRFQLTLALVLLVNIGRAWLLITCSFKVNESNRRRDQDVERERKRRIEIKEALEKRKIRDQLRQRAGKF